MNNYSKRIQLYKDCLTVLRLFDSPNEEVLKENVSILSHRKALEDVLLDINAMKINPFCYKSNENTIKFKYNLFFENKIADLENAIKRDECLERSTRSSELSAKAAEESAKQASKANERSLLTISISIFAAVISLGMMILEILKYL
jgi:hypothetical protein